MDVVCKNCGFSVENKYCSHCGQKTATARFSFKSLLHELIHGLFHVDHGLLFTARELLLRPGKMLKEYLAGHRVRYFNPFTFCLIIGGLDALLLQKIHWSGIFIDLDILEKQEINQYVWDASLKYFAYRLLLSVPVISMITLLFYRKSHYNFVEHLIANSYLRGEFWLLMLFLIPFQFLKLHTVAVIFRLLFLLAACMYLGWAFAGLYSVPALTKKSIVKGFAVAFIATLSDMAVMYMLVRLF